MISIGGVIGTGRCCSVNICLSSCNKLPHALPFKFVMSARIVVVEERTEQ